MRDVVIVGAVRTAIGKFGGALAAVSAPRLGAAAVRESLSRARVEPGEVDEVILGHILQAGTGTNTARQALLLSGIPESTPAFTVNKACASGMKAIALGALSIASGESDIMVVGGMENMSAAPFLLEKARQGYRLGDGTLVDCMIRDALSDPLSGCHMGITAENVASKFGISREAQDMFAAQSQRKVSEATAADRFGAEIFPLETPRKKGKSLSFAKDEFPRPETTVEILSGLKPAFKEGGTVTAGNSSGINDGAAAMVLMAAEAAEERGIKPQGRILAQASAGVDPLLMGMGPVPATKAVFAKAGVSLADVDLIELNEAFAAQSLAVIAQLGLDEGIVNVNGGAISLGHPVGASGARIVVTLLHAMAERGAELGLATLCIGGGQGMSMLIASCV
jgi:acetyl-CoA C-acetyltransferase